MIKTIGLFLLMLLKIFGCLLLALVLILLAVFLLVTFVPVRYDVKVLNERSMDPGERNPVKNIRVQVKASWLLHFIHVSFCYGPSGITKKIRAAGIDVLKVLAWFSNRKENRRSRKEKRKQKKSEKNRNTVQEQSTSAQALPEDTVQPERDAESGKSDEAGSSEGQKNLLLERQDSDKRDQQHISEEPDSSETHQQQDLEESDFAEMHQKQNSGEPDSAEAKQEPDTEEKDSGNRTSKNKKAAKRRKKKKVRARDSANAEKRKEPHSGRISSIRDKFAQFRKEYTDETNRSAVSHLWRELCCLLRSYKPKKFEAEIAFSLSDRAVTGEVLGIISMMPAVYRYPCSIIPDFTSEKLYIEGSLSAKGKVTVFVFLFSLLQLVRDKGFMKIVKRLMKRG